MKRGHHEEDLFHRITASSAPARAAHHLAGGPGGGGDAEAERAVLRRGRAADNGEEHPEPGAGQPKPIRTLKIWWPPVSPPAPRHEAQGIGERAEHDRPPVAEPLGERRKLGCPMPQARFWMAMASENSARGQPNCSEIGIWKSPKVARTPKPTSTIMQLATRKAGRTASGLRHGGSRIGPRKRGSPRPPR